MAGGGRGGDGGEGGKKGSGKDFKFSLFSHTGVKFEVCA